MSNWVKMTGRDHNYWWCICIYRQVIIIDMVYSCREFVVLMKLHPKIN